MRLSLERLEPRHLNLRQLPLGLSDLKYQQVLRLGLAYSMHPLDLHLHLGLLDLWRLENQKLEPLELMHLQVQHSEHPSGL
jgi:hypothetical protein